jgi:pimeloyl-ACP methyl ester carboxylesterase
MLHGRTRIGHNFPTPGRLGSDRPVIYFDQLGCGWSDKPEDPSLWHIERFVDEPSDVREPRASTHPPSGALLVWCLAIESMQGNPSGVAGLIFVVTTSVTLAP